MITVKKDKPEPEVKTLTEVLEEIAAAHVRIGKAVSNQRQHAVESQLRGIIRRLGYRPRETEAKPASIEELISQAIQALKILDGKAPEKTFEWVAQLALAVLSNLQAEENFKQSEVPEVPLVPGQ